MVKIDACVSDAELNDYLTGALSPEKKAEVERHLADCPTCLDKLVFAYQAVEEFNKTDLKGAKPMKSNWKRNLWLFGAIITFALSFFVARYFVQLLIATILMAAKWIFDTVNARILIMIYDAWKKGGEHEASKILRTLNNRMEL